MSILLFGLDIPKENPRTINIYRDGSWVDAYTTEDGRCIGTNYWRPIVGCHNVKDYDVRPVIVCAKCRNNNHCLTQAFVDDCGKIPLDRNTFFCADGEEDE